MPAGGKGLAKTYEYHAEPNATHLKHKLRQHRTKKRPIPQDKTLLEHSVEADRLYSEQSAAHLHLPFARQQSAAVSMMGTRDERVGQVRRTCAVT